MKLWGCGLVLFLIVCNTVVLVSWNYKYIIIIINIKIVEI